MQFAWLCLSKTWLVYVRSNGGPLSPHIWHSGELYLPGAPYFLEGSDSPRHLKGVAGAPDQDAHRGKEAGRPTGQHQVGGNRAEKGGGLL